MGFSAVCSVCETLQNYTVGSGYTFFFGGSTDLSGGNATGNTGSFEESAVETMVPTHEPAPAPTPKPTPAPTPAPYNPGVTCAVCGAADHTGTYCPTVSHYHGDGTDAGTCPGSGLGYSPLVGGGEEPLNPETHPELYC